MVPASAPVSPRYRCACRRCHSAWPSWAAAEGVRREVPVAGSDSDRGGGGPTARPASAGTVGPAGLDGLASFASSALPFSAAAWRSSPAAGTVVLARSCCSLGRADEAGGRGSEAVASPAGPSGRRGRVKRAGSKASSARAVAACAHAWRQLAAQTLQDLGGRRRLLAQQLSAHAAHHGGHLDPGGGPVLCKSGGRRPCKGRRTNFCSLMPSLAHFKAMLESKAWPGSHGLATPHLRAPPGSMPATLTFLAFAAQRVKRLPAAAAVWRAV
jgi:hypothetical protein